jgi:transcription antitermination factor NusG
VSEAFLELCISSTLNRKKISDPMTSEIFRWYALYTKPRWEKKVADLLTRKKIENYCPVNRVMRQWSDRKKVVKEPLFRSYVFVRIPEKLQNTIRDTDGVINIVYWLGKPAVIRDAEIEVIKRFLNDFDNVQLERAEVSMNDTIIVTNGPLMHREGNVIEVRHKSVKVTLSSLGYSLIAEVDKAHVEKLNFLYRTDTSAFPREQIKISS